MAIATIDFGVSPEPISDAQKNVENLIAKTPLKPEAISPVCCAVLTDPDVSRIIVENIPIDQQQEYITSSLLFNAIQKNEKAVIKSANGLFGPEVTIPAVSKGDGNLRPAETGQGINLEFLKVNGVDPNRVLLFRVTQPADEPKPENYWTTDYLETKRGLSREMGEADRQKAIILVSTLGKVAESGGLIADSNDDNGLAVRRIDTGNFDQSGCIGKITP